MVNVTTLDPADYPTWRWPMTARPRRPYAFETIDVIATTTIDGHPSGDWPSHDRYLDGPIYPHLLYLKPGDGDAFVEFVRQLGLTEILAWLADRFGDDHPRTWDKIVGAYEVLEHRQLARQLLMAAWTDQATAHRYDLDWYALADTFERIEDMTDSDEALHYVLAAAEAHQVLSITVEPHNGVVAERPTHIFARAWLELLDHLTNEGLLPRTCPQCSQPFLPSRTDQKYCSKEHREAFNETRRRKDPHRRQYHKLRRRRDRATTPEAKAEAQAALDEWANTNANNAHT